LGEVSVFKKLYLFKASRGGAKDDMKRGKTFSEGPQIVDLVRGGRSREEEEK